MARSRSLLSAVSTALVLVMGLSGWHAPFHWAEHLAQPGPAWAAGDEGGEPGAGITEGHCLSCTASTSTANRSAGASPWQGRLRGVVPLVTQRRGIAVRGLLASPTPRAPPAA